MKLTHPLMKDLITRRLTDFATQAAQHSANGDTDLAELLRDEGLLLARAYDDQEVILVAEALF